jgi:transposase
MAARNSPAFVEQALVKVFSRGDRSVQSVADEINVNYHTLKNWMVRKAVKKSETPAVKEKRPQDWSAQEQLVALHETHGMDGEASRAWCRERGIFPHHLSEWKAAFCGDKRSGQADAKTLRSLKDDNERLQRELLRKDKALAEAAALLILQKKFRALWEDEVK